MVSVLRKKLKTYCAANEREQKCMGHKYVTKMNKKGLSQKIRYCIFIQQKFRVLLPATG